MFYCVHEKKAYDEKLKVNFKYFTKVTDMSE